MFISYNDDGNKELEIYYKDGKRDGKTTHFYKNGQKQSEINYKNGELDGLTIHYFEDGTEKSRMNFKKGSRIPPFLDQASIR